MDWVSISVFAIFMSVVIFLLIQTFSTVILENKQLKLQKMELLSSLQQQRIRELELENRQLDLEIRRMELNDRRYL